MNLQKRLYWILGVGILGLIGAWQVRHMLPPRHQAAATPAPDPKEIAAKQELVRLRNAVIAAPTAAQPRWDLIDYYNRYGLSDKAGEQIVALIQLDPKDKKARIALANALLGKNEYLKADEAYRDVVDLDPNSIEALQGLAATLIKEHRYMEANSVAQRALKLNKDDVNTHVLLATSYLEYALQFPDPTSHANELNYARIELEDLTKALPDKGELFYLLGRACVGLHAQDGAVHALERAHALMPDHTDAARLLAIAYRAAHNDTAALNLVQQMIARKPDYAPFYDLWGQIYQDSGASDAPQKVLVAYKHAAELAPNDIFFHERLGKAYYQAGDLQSARTTFEKVTQLNPNRSFAFQQLAVIYTRLNQPQLASEAARIAKQATFNEQQLTQIQELSKKHPESVNLHLLLAERYRDLKLPGPARDEYLNVLRLDPKNSKVPKDLVQVLQASSVP